MDNEIVVRQRIEAAQAQRKLLHFFRNIHISTFRPTRLIKKWSNRKLSGEVAGTHQQAVQRGDAESFLLQDAAHVVLHALQLLWSKLNACTKTAIEKFTTLEPKSIISFWRTPRDNQAQVIPAKPMSPRKHQLVLLPSRFKHGHICNNPLS